MKATSLSISIILTKLLLALPLAAANVELSRFRMTQIYHSIRFSRLVYNRTLVNQTLAIRDEYDLTYLATFERTNIDRSLVALRGSSCYAVFRGTESNLQDWGQNLDLRDIVVPAGRDKNCTVRKGYDDNYSNRVAFDQAINRCLELCPDCELVFSGHSQGGATAVVASLYWYDRVPTVITFGAPKPVDSPCGLIDSENHYRFVNAGRNGTGGMEYDLVPMLSGVGARHFGHSFLLAEPGQVPAYVGLDENTNRVSLSIPLHSTTVYESRINYLHDLPLQDFPLTEFGWPNGSLCAYDDECETGRCFGERDLFASNNYCASKLDACESCGEDSDCESGQCVLRSGVRTCALPSGLMPNGCLCNFDQNCESEMCDGFFPPYRCSGQACEVDGDCLLNSTACLEGVCMMVDPEDPLCGTDDDCPDQRCAMGVCQNSTNSPSAAPNTMSSQVPSATLNATSSQVPSAIPNTMSSQMPSATLNATSSQVPSAIPNTMSSQVPSAMPNSMSSQIPSATSSTVPSATPTQTSVDSSSLGTPIDSPKGAPEDLPTGSPVLESAGSNASRGVILSLLIVLLAILV